MERQFLTSYATNKGELAYQANNVVTEAFPSNYVCYIASLDQRTQRKIPKFLTENEKVCPRRTGKAALPETTFVSPTTLLSLTPTSFNVIGCVK